MTMKIVRSGISRPPVLLLFGSHKLGKSTFAAGCPNPLFIQTESGLEGLDVDTFPLVNSLDEFHQALDSAEKTTGYKTLVIDSLDWLERLIFRHVCAQHKVNDIAQIGFAKGYVAAEALWGEIIDRLAVINKTKKMIIVLIAHATVQKIQDPEREDYDCMLPDLHKRSVNLLSEYVDILSYCSLKLTTVSKDKGPAKAKTTGERVMYLTPRGGFTAGNRYGLPDSLPLSWAALATELKKKAKTVAQIEEVKPELTTEQAQVRVN